MKIHLGSYTFRDEDFWDKFDPKEAVRNFIRGADQFEQQGGKFTITDTSNEHYIRAIDIWAEHSNESVITMLVLRQDNK